MAIPLLLTADEGAGSLAATRGLRAAGYAPIVAVGDANVYAARSRAAAEVVLVPDPKKDPEAFADAVADAARASAVAAVLPCTEGSLRALTGREARFPPGVAVGTCPPERVERALDKTLLAELGRRSGLDVPTTVELTPGELADRIDEVVLPAIVKPPASVLAAADGTFRSFEVERADSADELRAALARYDSSDRCLVQQWVDGTLSAACGVAWNGEVVCLSQQMSPRIWPPQFGISSFAVTVAPDERVGRGVRALIQHIEWSGVFGVQFLRDRDRTWLIDLNPRVYGSMQLAIAAGHNLPAIWADLLLGRDPQVPPYRVGVGYRVEEDDVRALAHRFASGRRSEAMRGLLPRPRTSHAVFSLRDPAPLAITARKLFSRAGVAPGRGSCRGSSRGR